MTDRITRGDIVDTALALLAKGGFPALAMRQIAGALDVQQSALYWHFDNKQLLLAALADRIVADVDAPSDTAPGDWRARVTALATALRAAVLRYPDGAELVATAIAFRLGGDQPARRLATELTRAGHTVDDAEVAASVLVHFTLGYTTDEQQYRQAAALGALDGDATVTESFDERFARGVHLILAGTDQLR